MHNRYQMGLCCTLREGERSGKFMVLLTWGSPIACARHSLPIGKKRN